MLNWTEEQLLGLAPDTFTIRAARGLAKPKRWDKLGRNQHGAWGTLSKTGNKEPFRTLLVFEEMTLWCTCQSTKAPCNHGLALILLLVGQADAFKTAVSPPAWFTARQERLHQQKQRPVSPANNLQLLLNGIDALDLWLKDLIRRGLADLPARPKQYWTAMADQMVDAEAPLIAHTLHSLSKIPVKNKAWPEQYLRQLGRLYMIVQGFKHWERQSPETQADLKTAVGRLPDQQGSLKMTGDWLVMGRHQAQYGRRRRLFVWLWSTSQNRPATLLQQITPGSPTTHHYPTGTLLTGTIQYAAGNWPTFGLLPALLSIKANGDRRCFGFGGVGDVLNDYAQSKAVSPWLPFFPFLLTRVKPIRHNDAWSLIDKTGSILPLAHSTSRGWHLKALSNGRYLSLFGTWDGTTLTPISVLANTGWLDLSILRGIR